MVIWFSMTKPTVAVVDRPAVGARRARARRPGGAAPPGVRRPRQGPHHAAAPPHPHRRHPRRRRGRRAPPPALTTGTRSSPGSARSNPRPTGSPGSGPGYHLTCGMTILAEIVHRLDGRRFETYVRDEVFTPLGMDDCWVGMPSDVVDGLRRSDRHHAQHRHRRGHPARHLRRAGVPRRAACPAVAGAVRCGSSAVSTKRCWRAASSTAAACSDRRRSRRSPRATASGSTTRRSTRSATGASASRSTPTRWAGTRRRARSGTAARCRRSPSPIPSTGSWPSCRPTACAATTTTTSASMPSPPRSTKTSAWSRPARPGRDKPFPSVELTAATD